MLEFICPGASWAVNSTHIMLLLDMSRHVVPGPVSIATAVKALDNVILPASAASAIDTSVATLVALATAVIVVIAAAVAVVVAAAASRKPESRTIWLSCEQVDCTTRLLRGLHNNITIIMVITADNFRSNIDRRQQCIEA
ncbi:hypothetical protein SAMD00019534_025020 [Acytostelium subglobosum LB1]|uniref:hypothetical protein n=1 Tax=Acytostelium subglobosum LB1 TaxID=1410327 RepID=UPI000644A8F5|nr:hypothetical protein SAMD00019534_025020 [Acytostelium subglobosum LB1]GAM19327.1 hypothetical protein SAMD00019534_025020 [Acytostelium subglobosum LB1]|eukprot:XP_012757254.1 hypothetical protein SAMD00019534_025020 [Acytostelium subglobosum LB1]